MLLRRDAASDCFFMAHWLWSMTVSKGFQMTNGGQPRFITLNLGRDEITLLSHALIEARNKALSHLSDTKGLEHKVLEDVVRGYGDILNKIENAPWVKVG